MQDGIRRFCQQLTFDEKKQMVKMHNDYLQKNQRYAEKQRNSKIVK